MQRFNPAIFLLAAATLPGRTPRPAAQGFTRCAMAGQAFASRPAREPRAGGPTEPAAPGGRRGVRVYFGRAPAGRALSAALEPAGARPRARRFSSVRRADLFPGADAGAQIRACLLSLPANGGVCDARSIVPAGDNAYAAEDVFAGVRAPFTLWLGPYTLVVSAPQVMSAIGSIRGEGPQSLVYYSASAGTLLTVDYPRGAGLADFPMAGLYDLYLGGPGGESRPGGPTATVGVQLGPVGGTSGGASGFTLDHVSVRQFGTNVALGNNAYSIRLDHDFFEDAGIDVLLPAGQTNSGEMISLVDDFVADAGTGVAIRGQGYEVEAVNSSFDFDNTAVSVTAPSAFTSVNAHWENLNLRPFVVASAGQVTIQGGQFVSDATSGAWPEYVAGSGTANISASGTRVGSFGSSLQSFVRWSSSGRLTLLGNSVYPTGAVRAIAAGFGAASKGVVADPAQNMLSVAANATVYGTARLGSEGLGGAVARNGITVGTQRGRTVLQWQSYGGGRGPYLAVAPGRPEILEIGTDGRDYISVGPGGSLSDPRGGAAFGSLAVGGGAPLHQVLEVVATLTFPVIGAQTCAARSTPLAGAAPGAGVLASPTAPLGSTSLVWSAWVSNDGQATVRLCNPTAAAIAPRAAAWAIWALQ